MTQLSNNKRSGDDWHKQRMACLVRDEFTCRWAGG